MKIEISKNVKRALSMVIAVALLLGTLFTANVGVNIKADATIGSGKTVVYLTDSNKEPDSKFMDGTHGAGTEDNPYIISTPGQLCYVVKYSTEANSTGVYYQMDPTIDIMVLQTESYITSVADSLDAFLALDAKRTKEALSKETGRTKFDSYATGASFDGFAGVFDFNGVTICGMYNEDGGLFACARAATIKNLCLSNNYLTSTDYCGNLVGCVRNSSTAAPVTYLTIDTVEIKNCYQNNTGVNGFERTGVMLGFHGFSYYIGLKVSNILTYGNISKGTTSKTDSTLKYCALYGSLAGGWNGKDNKLPVEERVDNAYFEDIVTLDCVPYPIQSVNNQTTRLEYWNDSIYTTHYDANHKPCTSAELSQITAIKQINAEDIIGVKAKTAMPDLLWASDSKEGKWYAIEGGYPTLFKPDDWHDAVLPYFSGSAAGSFAGGTGSKEDPYKIKTADQLYKMVTDGAETEGKYYTIADGVEKLYLNNIVTTNDAATNYSAIKALVDGGSYSKWNATADFYGNFDGNGVKIVGMVSYNGKGFVGKMCNNATVKNVNFESCYVYSSNRAAVVATDFGLYNAGDHYPTISNVSVRKSYINSQQGGISLKNSKPPYEFWYSTAGGIASCIATSDMLTITNCMYDGTSSKLVQKDYANGDVEVDASAGILSMASSVNNVTISNCVSLGAPIITEGVGKGGAAINYVRYKSDSKVTATNCYTNTDLTLTSIDGKKVDASYWNAYPLPTTINRVNATDNKYERGNFLYLDWANSWKLVTIDNDTVIPMPTSSTFEPIKSTYTTFGKMLVAHNGIGLRSGSYPNQNGTFGWYHELTGSGTKADPYIIDTAEKLAIAIATGGKNVNQKLYYKLGCDINLGLLPWIDQTQVGKEYAYTPFEGTLDGDGHTVSGLSSIDKSNSAGLIPVLNGGTVKNLHMRNSYAGSTTSAGVIAGSANGGTIIGCSLESSCTGGTSSSAFYGTGTATVKDSYSIVDDVATYYNNSGATAEPTTDFYSSTNPNGTWYKGVGGTPRLVNFAKAHTIADIDGDGVVSDNYTPNDVIALRKFLLGASDYKNIFGDVTGNGKTNISDLAIIRREMVGDYEDIKDGFWRNVELGAVKIYYDQNDSQDMARKLELYLESVYPEVDIVKVAGTAVTDTAISAKEKADYNNQDNAIVITKAAPTEDTYKNYSVNYDVNTNVLTVSGNSFTAVEQATLDLISQLQGNSNTANPTNISGAIGTNKFAKTVNGTTYYYAWGDEFDTGKTYSADTWKVKNYRSEGNDLDAKTVSEGRNTHYFNLESTNSASLESLWEVNGGKLTIWRGYNVDATNAAWSNDYAWGYKPVHAGAAGTTNDFGSIIDNDDIYIEAGLITTEQSMMFKQGYAEMRASLPSDGYAFPAWWFYNGTSAKYNVGMTQNLYGKVYETNSDWNGDAKMTQGNLRTYQYKVPQAYLEFDIVEFMQAQSGKSGKNATTTGDYRDYINLTVHKIYDQNATSDLSTLYIPNWSTGTTTEISNANFVNTASSAGFIHRYNPDRTTANYKHTYTTSSWWWENEYNTAASYSIQKAIEARKMTQGQTSVTDYYTYGFSWTVDKNAKTYDLTVYVDFNEDGVMASDEIIFNMNQTNGHESSYNGSSFTDPIYNSSDLSADCAVWDQYAYMLLDNSFKTSNPLGSGNTSDDGVTMYTDLLTQKSGNGTAGATDKTTFDIEYVRVYQQNGKRDLVTAETEAFNTGSHFGY